MVITIPLIPIPSMKKSCDDSTIAEHHPPPMYGGGGILSQIGEHFSCSKNRLVLSIKRPMVTIKNDIPRIRYLLEMAF